MIIIGVDPGKGGGVAIIHTVKKAVSIINVYTTPIAGKNIDVRALTNIFDAEIGVYGENYDEHTTIAYIEKVNAMPGQGVSSMFSFGFSTGIMHGVIGGLSIPIELVTPQAWKKKVLAGLPKDKLAAIEFCRRQYPNVSLLATLRSHKAHTGLSDALCIAHYGLLMRK